MSPQQSPERVHGLAVAAVLEAAHRLTGYLAAIGGWEVASEADRDEFERILRALCAATSKLTRLELQQKARGELNFTSEGPVFSRLHPLEPDGIASGPDFSPIDTTDPEVDLPHKSDGSWPIPEDDEAVPPFEPVPTED